MSSPYNPAAWYWVVASNTAQVWSSAAAAYVPTTDTTYATWLAAGNRPTVIDTEASLHDVLMTAYPAGVGALGTVPQRAAVLLAGTTITLTSAATPALNGTYTVTPASTANMTALQAAVSAGVPLPGGGTTLPYTDAAGTDHAFTALQFTAFAAAVMGYVFGLTRCAIGKSASLPSAALTIP